MKDRGHMLIFDIPGNLLVQVVAWSEPFPQDLVLQIAEATGASSSEVSLSPSVRRLGS